jgi:hypothetical protein
MAPHGSTFRAGFLDDVATDHFPTSQPRRGPASLEWCETFWLRETVPPDTHSVVSSLNTLSWRDHLERGVFKYMRRRMIAKAARIEWVSYHVPKTAGTSFREALRQAFGPARLFAVYDNSCGTLTRGEPIWIPSSASIVHGHFRPHLHHPQLFAHGKRIIWLRDPVKRAWSLLNHTLDVRNNKTLFQLVKTEFLDRGITDREEIFRSLISRRPRFFREYEANCQSLDRDFFHFVGCTDRYAEDLRRLANMMQRPLAAERLNLGENTQQLPSLTANELAFFDEEYRIYERLARARD